MKQIAFILHGKIRKKDRLWEEIKDTFRNGYDLDLYLTERKQHAMSLAESAVLKGAAYIICMGGDGSLNEVVNGVMNALERLGRTKADSIRIGLLPLGRGNDFARTLTIPGDLPSIKKSIDEDRYLPIDLGRAEFTNQEGHADRRYFINITDVGMGGVIAQKTAGYSRWMGGRLTFQRAIISTLLSYRKTSVTVQADSFQYEGQVMNLVIANGKFFGSGLGIAPEARVDDGLFSIVVIGDISVMDFLKLQGTVRKCRLLDHPEVKYFSAKAIDIHSSGDPLPIDMDGEFIGLTPLRIHLVPNALGFLVL